MGMAIRDRDWTVARIHALPDDGKRYEVIDGQRFVTPAPSFRHQVTAVELARTLGDYVRSIGQVIAVAPTAVTFSARREVQPDLLVLPAVDGRVPESFSDVGRLTLAVEILSPRTRRVDRIVKRALFADEGVPEYWIVDADRSTIERWTPTATTAELHTTSLTWQPDPRFAALTIDLVELFRRTREL
jgi:Uma2 family endonuclease